MEVVVFNDEGAPSEVVIRVAHVDNLTELVPNLVKDVKHFFFVGHEIAFVAVGEYHILLDATKMQLVVVSR